MKKLITIISLLFLGIANITQVKAESISFDDATFINYYSSNYGYEMNSNLTEFGNSVFTWFIPEFNDLIYESGGIISSIIFYDIFGSQTVNGDGYVGEVDVYDLEPTGPYPQNLSGTYQFNLLDYGFTQEEVDSIKSIRVRIMVSHSSPPSGFGPALADAVFVTSGQLPKVTFVHEGSVWFETVYVGTINEPPTEPPTVGGFAFDTWYDEDGNVLNTFKTYHLTSTKFNKCIILFTRTINIISKCYKKHTYIINSSTRSNRIRF